MNSKTRSVLSIATIIMMATIAFSATVAVTPKAAAAVSVGISATKTTVAPFQEFSLTGDISGLPNEGHGPPGIQIMQGGSWIWSSQQIELSSSWPVMEHPQPCCMHYTFTRVWWSGEGGKVIQIRVAVQDTSTMQVIGASNPVTITITGTTPPPPPPATPIAEAGPNQYDVKINTKVTLDGKALDSTTHAELPIANTKFYWDFVPTYLTATLTNPTTAKPSFTPTQVGTYFARLTVKYGASEWSPHDWAKITVYNPNPTLTVGNSPIYPYRGQAFFLYGHLRESSTVALKSSQIKISGKVLGSTAGYAYKATVKTDSTGLWRYPATGYVSSQEKGMMYKIEFVPSSSKYISSSANTKFLTVNIGKTSTSIVSSQLAGFSKKISGYVKDEYKHALPGATVMVKHRHYTAATKTWSGWTSTATTTDANGYYKMLDNDYHKTQWYAVYWGAPYAATKYWSSSSPYIMVLPI